MKNAKHILIKGLFLLLTFVLWTLLIITVDVKPIGVCNTDIGFSTINTWFHHLTGVHMELYILTDWLSLIPIFVCISFAVLGGVQLIKRKSLLKVDYDILLLGLYYIVVIACYLAFEIIPINYRPILIEGIMEVSYPSSTTLLVLCIMPTLVFQISRRVDHAVAKKTINILIVIFILFMVVSRLISGVHWLTDIIGGILLSAGLSLIYIASVYFLDENIKH